MGLKLRLFHAYYRLCSLWYRMRGIEVGKHCIISGRPRFFRAKGTRVIIEDNAVLHSKIKYNTLIRLPMELSTVSPGAEIRIGSHCGLSGCQIICAKKVSIGSYTIVGPDTVIYDCKEHEYNSERGWLGRTTPHREGKEIKIGERCYIGMRCIILKGVSIGDDCVIAAGTLVNRDVPNGYLAMGNPVSITPLPERLGGPGASNSDSAPPEAANCPSKRRLPHPSDPSGKELRSTL